MIAKIYWCETKYVEGSEDLVVRQEEMVPFQSREWLDKQLMMKKIEGTLAGYEIYDFNSQDEFIEMMRDPRQWEAFQAKKVDSWYDKDAMAGSVTRRSGPVTSAAAFSARATRIK